MMRFKKIASHFKNCHFLSSLFQKYSVFIFVKLAFLISLQASDNTLPDHYFDNPAMIYLREKYNFNLQEYLTENPILFNKTSNQNPDSDLPSQKMNRRVFVFLIEDNSINDNEAQQIALDLRLHKAQLEDQIYISTKSELQKLSEADRDKIKSQISNSLKKIGYDILGSAISYRKDFHYVSTELRPKSIKIDFFNQQLTDWAIGVEAIPCLHNCTESYYYETHIKTFVSQNGILKMSSRQNSENVRRFTLSYEKRF